MTINYWFLCIALLLLWLPRRWLRVGKPDSRRPSTDPPRERLPQDLALRGSEELLNRRNWLDFFRALAGGMAVAGDSGAISVYPGAEEQTLWLVFTIQAIILILAVVGQTLRFAGRISLFPPIFFIAGLMFGVLGWMPALLAFIAIWAIHVALPTPTIFLLVYGVLLFALGLLLGALPEYAGLATALSWLPMVVSLIFKRRLLPVAKKAKLVGR